MDVAATQWPDRWLVGRFPGLPSIRTDQVSGLSDNLASGHGPI